MLHNIYTALSGSLAQERVLEIIANNLANMNTVGFKEESVTFKILEPEPENNYVEILPEDNFKISLDDLMPLRGNEISYVGVSGVSRNDLQGSAIDTKNPMDLMIEGEGYFAVHTNEGVRYTRSGAFTINPDGAVVDKFGNAVMGERGSIFLSGAKVEVNHRGEIYQSGELVDRIPLYNFKDKNFLEKIGNNQFYYSGPENEVSNIAHPAVRQGYLEASNVNAIKNLTNMIIAHRSHEAYQKAIKNYDSMMEKSNNTLAVSRG